MKFSYTTCIMLLSSLLGGTTVCAQQNEVSGVYVGGHIRRQRPNTITTLRNSGFIYVLLFNVHVDKDGTLMTDGETICKDGEYVFTKTQPYYQTDVANLKKAPTGISRIDIVIGGWGNDSYNNIKALIEANGVGENTMLYKNFKALKEAVPEIDGVNNDDEQCYDVNSASKFHIMMYDLGYKTTLAPYMNQSFWTNLCSKVRSARPGSVDRVMIQCYDGGAGNNPKNWSFTGVSNRHAGRTNYQTNMDTSIAQMETWAKDKAAVGGFVWVYNDETWNLNQWASAMNRTFKAKTTPADEVVLKCYSGSNYTGYCIELPEGEFMQADLAVYGLAADDLESVEIKEGYKARLYVNNNCKGSYRPVNESMAKLSSTYLNRIKSIKIELIETAIGGVTDKELKLHAENNVIDIDNGEGKNLAVYNTSGALILQHEITYSNESLDLSYLPRGIYVIKVDDHTLKIHR